MERIPTPHRLVDWLAVNGLAVGTQGVDSRRRDSGRDPGRPPPSAVRVINDNSVQGRAATVLTPEGDRRWRLGSASRVEDALSVIAADAISIIAGERDGKLALCASPTCRAAFFDTSQSRTRKW